MHSDLHFRCCMRSDGDNEAVARLARLALQGYRPEDRALQIRQPLPLRASVQRQRRGLMRDLWRPSAGPTQHRRQLAAALLLAFALATLLGWLGL
ncbi:hypothetical protein [Oceanibacterium hippocampi]|uniref:Uncharacterized protein n=1 Tax=Oceanibacterium hippocampi TaxID=745714 RepID=A0A1Y5ST55_9PROT|nr:hypothetical protein [Oceanibacterium hippocampi]SLN47742.1 hypothetical protein OCH7691_02059 [Oceanibacterium hippocampi]